MTNPKVDAFLEGAGKWQAAFTALRPLIRDCGLAEDFKWGNPCYAMDGRNIVLMHGFKDYCALLLFKGALLDDPAGILVQQTQNVQAARQVRFTDVRQVVGQAETLKAYIRRAIDVEKTGAKIAFKATTEFAMPEEFRVALENDDVLKTAFEALTPGRQRGYLLHFSSAKQAATRQSRIEKCIPQIMDGLGLND